MMVVTPPHVTYITSPSAPGWSVIPPLDSVPTSTLQCPPYSCWNLVSVVESSGIQWSQAEWAQIPVDSTGLQTEIETELEPGSKYMCVVNTSMVYKLTLWCVSNFMLPASIL